MAAEDGQQASSPVRRLLQRQIGFGVRWPARFGSGCGGRLRLQLELLNDRQSERVAFEDGGFCLQIGEQRLAAAAEGGAQVAKAEVHARALLVELDGGCRLISRLHRYRDK